MIIEEHDPSKPLFLYLPFQNVHFPVQAPQKYVDKYSFIKDKQRRTYAAMLDIVDEAIGNVTSSLEKAGYTSSSSLFLLLLLLLSSQCIYSW